MISSTIATKNVLEFITVLFNKVRRLVEKVSCYIIAVYTVLHAICFSY